VDMHTSIMCINILQNIKAVAPKLWLVYNFIWSGWVIICVLKIHFIFKDISGQILWNWFQDTQNYFFCFVYLIVIFVCMVYVFWWFLRYIFHMKPHFSKKLLSFLNGFWSEEAEIFKDYLFILARFSVRLPLFPYDLKTFFVFWRQICYIFNSIFNIESWELYLLQY
jgi:hypothetical protein